MPWVRFDDLFPINRKVDGLSDTAFRLHVSAIFWCARNLTDGCVPEEDLELVTARVRAPARFVTELVARGLWHEAGFQCGSEQCPPSGVDGWVIHDYFEYQPSKVKVAAERSANAARQQKWRETHKSTGADSNGVIFGSNPDKEAPYNGVSNAVTNALVTAPRPVPYTSSKEEVVTPPNRNAVTNGVTEPVREDTERICTHLADRIEGNGSKRPTITSRWRQEARLLIDRDQREEPHIIRIIDWCQKDPFWRKNILSMPKLREKYDQLRLAAQDDQRRRPQQRLVGADTRDGTVDWADPHILEM